MPARMSTFWFSIRSCTLAAATSGWPVVSATITWTGWPATMLSSVERYRLKPSELSFPTLAIGPVSASSKPILIGLPLAAVDGSAVVVAAPPLGAAGACGLAQAASARPQAIATRATNKQMVRLMRPGMLHVTTVWRNRALMHLGRQARLVTSGVRRQAKAIANVDMRSRPGAVDV